jgi:hypothetical protein
MLTENGVRVDYEAVAELLRRADVLTIGFTLFPARLLIDARTNATEGPLVAIVGPVASVEERYLWLGKHRGSFGAPEAFSFFVWPKTVHSLASGDVLAPLRERLDAVSRDAGGVLRETLGRLQVLEDEAVAAAVKGVEPWQTLWQRQ